MVKCKQENIKDNKLDQNPNIYINLLPSIIVQN